MAHIDPDHLEMHIDEKAERIYFPMKENQDAELKYTLHTKGEPNVMEFTHTFVPEPVRNIGIGKRLAEEGLKLAEANGYQIKPSCEFIASYVDKRPHYQKMVA